MDKIRNFLEVIQNLVKKKKHTPPKNENEIWKEKEIQDKQDSIDNKINEPPTSTVNKLFLKKMFVIFLAFLATVYIGSRFVSSDNKADTRVEVATNLDNEITKEMSEDYVNLVKKEQEKRSKLKINDENETVKSDTAKNNNIEIRTDKDDNIERDTNTRRNTASSVPSINPYMTAVYNPYMNMQTQLQKQQQDSKKDERDERKEKQKEAYSSAITFMNTSTNTSSAESTDDTDTTISASNSVMTYTTPKKNSLFAGTVIPLVLLNGINSQLKGQITAQVQNNVYDSLNGVNVLIPAGTKLIGSYASGAKQGQNRVDVEWKTMIMPEGIAYNIEGIFQSADSSGYPGIPGKVNNHTASKISAGAISSALAALGSVAAGNNTYGNDYGWHNSGQLAVQGASANLLNTASEIVKQKLEMESEITVAPGTVFSVYLTQTISF